ncbi:probable phosphoglycerate mutase [Pedococcus dokdonensis]|uniref:Probable phosphoglycerate mutase n=1 Tax=Pedococcus dokdonensis TaxID=443156 RepID=A0A1H0PW48_9MICO|nr:bifunctional RNase H/acid phosphatase [Pedococcus dokdonensis]SDP09387.1 probable phosphoglycerate mutase [Pedococcus dokdonensis]
MSRRRLVVEADGGSRGNPGVAGYGALVRDGADGRVLWEGAAPLGKESNNVAEYSGLIAGLRAVLRIDAGADVEVRMDSKLVVEQMAGRWKIKHPDMRQLALEARDLASQVSAAGGSVSFTWIPRERNKDADALSNDGMDGRTIDRMLGPDREGASAATMDEFIDEVVDEVIDPVPSPAPVSPGEGNPTRIVLVRHGVTDFTVASRLDGRGGADPGLNTAGQAQAAAAGRATAHLLGGSPARVVTSSLARAVQTGAAVADAIGVEATVDRDWDEQDFGDWDGQSIPDLVRDEAEALLALRADPAYARPGGESHDQLAARVVAAFERVVAAGGTTVVVCHRKPIMCVLAHVLGIPHDKVWRLAAAPGSLTALEVWPDGNVSVAFTNRT